MSQPEVAAYPRVAVLGAGRMGQAVISGLLEAGWDRQRLVAAESHEPSASSVRARFGIEVTEATAAVRGAEVVVVVVKPHDVVGLLDAIAGHLAPEATVVSLAAGLGTATLAAHLPPGTALVRVMPNTPALVGQGMSVISPAAGCPAESVALAERVLGAVGQVRQVPETLQDAGTAVSGSGPAYVFYVAEAMIDAGVLLGLSRPLARDLVVQTLLGSATMLAQTGEHPAVLRENVTSPGGTTAAALHVLDDSAVRAAFANAMTAARDRSRELGAG